MASPLDHAWYVLKAPHQRDATPISMAGGNAPVRSHDDMGMGSSPGGRRASENNAMKREMARQRKDAQEGETRDPLEMGELENVESRPPVNPIDASEFDPQSAEEKAATRRYIEDMMRGGFPPKM